MGCVSLSVSLMLPPIGMHVLMCPVFPALAEPGGSWGYDSTSVDAVRFSPSKDVVLGGVGLFGGRTASNYEVTVSPWWYLTFIHFDYGSAA